MAALYPSAPPIFYTRTNLSDVVNAGDVNVIYAELAAVTTVLNVTPSKRSAPWSTSATFTTGSTVEYNTVSDRILNVENGTYIVYSDFISRTAQSGANTIIPSATYTTANLVVQAKPSGTQTANLFEARNSTGGLITYVQPDGSFRTPVIDGGSA